MYKPLILLSLFLAVPLFGCSSDSTPQPVLGDLITPPPPPPPVAAADVGGTWFSRVANNAVNCGLGEFIDAAALVITQDVNDITLLTSTGVTFTGTVNGDIVEWTGEFDERGGTTTFTSLSVTVAGNAATGNAAWTWTDGTDSCNGTMDITLSRDWAVVEAGPNSTPILSLAFTFTDSVAFFKGTVNASGDPADYFSFVLAADATVRADLSHFDFIAKDLGLELLDENLNQIALSDSTDSFENIESQLQAGMTYYIGVIANATLNDEPYNLSIDVN